MIVGAWLFAAATSLGLIWTPWRLARHDTVLDLRDTLSGRPVSPLHAFVVPVLVLLAPLAILAVGGPGLLAHPHLYALPVLIALSLVVIAQLVLRREMLRAIAQREAERGRSRTILASAGRKSSARPR